ncbi:MAG TPA: sulfatase-like hydrolase/transferase [Gammaproteobacteria bacterium]|nr:sulfatase-like hydrolase/transferase [Gammaproteobacteria bacterium]
MVLVKLSRRLIRVLTSLTVLFIIAQVSFFMIHYKVSELVDVLVNSSISNFIFYPTVILPIIQFVAMQLFAYFLLIIWIHFVAISIGELFRLPDYLIDWLGIVFWVLSLIAILGLNFYYFPGSFFAKPFHEYLWLNKNSHLILTITISSLTVVMLLAYINYFWFKRYRISGGIFLLIGLVMISISFYNKVVFVFQSVQNNQTKPNIILIGLDSLRPDFTGYFGNSFVHTPTIDYFLRSAVTFSQAYTPLARTFPAWISILTAKYPKHTGARNNLVDITQLVIEDTLAKRLQQAGYETIYATDEKRFSNITKSYGFDQIVGPSMGVNDFLLGSLTDFPLNNLLLKLPVARFLFPYQYANRAASITYEPDDFLQLIELALAQRTNKPLFLAVHLCLTHWPFTWARDGQPEKFSLPQRYHSSVEAIDRQFGKLMQILKQQKLLEHSLVVLLSDHGTTLGLPGDRIIKQKNYLGDKQKIKNISVAKLSSMPQKSLDFKHNYTIETSYGQATDVLSLKQYHVLLGFKGFGMPIQPRSINYFVSLMDIAPTILDYLKITPLEKIDAVSLVSMFSAMASANFPKRSFFIETGDKLSEIETDNIYIEKVLRKQINVYRVHPDSGLLFISPEDEKYIVQAKQRAVLQDGWLLAYYPMTFVTTLVRSLSSTALTPNIIFRNPYYVLVNLKSGQWTIGLSSAWAKSAPIDSLKQQLKTFYGNEIIEPV